MGKIGHYSIFWGKLGEMALVVQFIKLPGWIQAQVGKTSCCIHYQDQGFSMGDSDTGDNGGSATKKFRIDDPTNVWIHFYKKFVIGI